MKNKFIYIIIAVQTLVMITCILFSILHVKEAKKQREATEEQKRQAISEKEKSEKIMLQYYELRKEFEACCQR